MDIQSHAETFFDDCRYCCCVMMSYGREQGRGGMIKGAREGMKRQERISKTNNGTKMATASTTGRVIALRPPDRREETPCPGRLACCRRSNKMAMTRWNHQGILSRHQHQHRHHRHRRANMAKMNEIPTSKPLALGGGTAAELASLDGSDPAGAQRKQYGTRANTVVANADLVFGVETLR
ncbi:unnamed protein product [Merluccius merluccius]